MVGVNSLESLLNAQGRYVLRKGDQLVTLARIEMEKHEVLPYSPVAIQAGCIFHVPRGNYKLLGN